MRINDDKAVMEHLFRHNTMRAYPQSLAAFCQWCAEQRVANETRQFLLCPVCDEGDE